MSSAMKKVQKLLTALTAAALLAVGFGTAASAETLAYPVKVYGDDKSGAAMNQGTWDQFYTSGYYVYFQIDFNVKCTFETSMVNQQVTGDADLKPGANTKIKYNGKTVKQLNDSLGDSYGIMIAYEPNDDKNLRMSVWIGGARGELFNKDLYDTFTVEILEGAIVLVTIADQIFWKTDQLIVGYYFGAAAVAVYSVGSQIYTIYMTIGTAASSVFLPRVSELYCQNKDMSEISDLFIKVGRISFIVCGFVLSLFIVLGKDFIIIWAGKDYIDAFYIALIVMVPFTIDLIQNLGLTIMQVANVYLYRGYMYLAIALVNVVVTIILLKLMGIVGAAVSTAIAMVIGNGFCMNWYYSEKLGLNIKKFWLEIAKLSVLVIAGTGALLLLYNLIKSLLSGLVVVLVSAIIYFFIYFSLVLMFGLNESEKTSISAFIKR